MDETLSAHTGDGNAPDAEIVITPHRAGKGTKVRLVATFPAGGAYTDTIDIAVAADRANFRNKLVERCPGLTPQAVDQELENIAADTLGDGDGGGKSSAATRLVALVERTQGLELFHTPGGHDSEGYATIPIGEHRETWPIGSKAFKRWLSRAFYLAEGKTPGGQALTDAIGVLAGKAIHEGPEHEVFVRLAEVDGAIWLDLADDAWRAVKVTASGWSVVQSAQVPVKFIRRRGMLPLPEPGRGGSISMLRPLVNLPGEEQWVLVVAWLVAALRPGRPVPMLAINGEQGSCKSTLSRMLRALIDPNKAPLRAPPKEERDLVIAAGNGLVVAFDNVSGISDMLSDALCRLATGGGFGTRELYSDDAEKLFEGTRPILLNGIDDVATRADALDRALNVTLPVVPEEERTDEDELWARFHELHPLILGSLLDAIAAAIKNRPRTRLPAKPRMADFALWVVAAEPLLPWGSGAFLAAYQGNRGEANNLAIEASPVAMPILALIEARGHWTGTAGELLAALEEKYADERTRMRKDWPINRKAMGNALRRVAPNLRAAGVTVTLPEKGTGHKKRRIIELATAPAARSARSALSADLTGQAPGGCDVARGADHSPPAADRETERRGADRPLGVADPGPETPAADRADHADHRSPDSCVADDDWGSV